MEWQPIETAPRNGTDILAYERIADTDRILTMRYDEVAQAFVTNVHSFVAFEPTHWMPLPAPPIKQKPEIPEGFTEWDGAHTPLGPGFFLEVMYRDGEISGPYPSDEVFAYWEGDEHDDDLIAYCVVEND